MVKYDFYYGAAGVVLADQMTKWLVAATISPGSFIALVGSVGLTALRNSGASFGMLKGWNVILIGVSLVAGAAVVVWQKKLAPWKGGTLLCGLLLGGILGNLIDRLFFGSVFDFIKVGWWPAFNIADATLTLCVIGLLLRSLKET